MRHFCRDSDFSKGTALVLCWLQCLFRQSNTIFQSRERRSWGWEVLVRLLQQTRNQYKFKVIKVLLSILSKSSLQNLFLWSYNFVDQLLCSRQSSRSHFYHVYPIKSAFEFLEQQVEVLFLYIFFFVFFFIYNSLISMVSILMHLLFVFCFCSLTVKVKFRLPWLV